MKELLAVSLQEIPRALSSLLLLALAWGVGHRISTSWTLHQKKKENDLTTARDFHSLYGEFFAVWKLWNYFLKEAGSMASPGASRWNLLDRACVAEGKLESILVRL